MPLLFQHLPCELVPMYFELDGTFPNHPANPIDPAAMVDLQKTVVDQQCDLGVAFDGDADRMFLVDENGKLIGGDITTAMVAIALLEQQPKSTICYNLICSRSVPETILAHGGRPYRTPVGHSLIKKIMRAEDAIFGGEHSGHYYFRDNWYADSGLIAMLAVLSLLSAEAKPLSEVVEPIENRFRSGEVNLKVDDKPAAITRVKSHFTEQGAAIDEFDGLTVEFPDRWFNIRASNTEPLLRVNVEGDTEEAMTAAQGRSALGDRRLDGSRRPSPHRQAPAGWERGHVVRRGRARRAISRGLARVPGRVDRRHDQRGRSYFRDRRLPARILFPHRMVRCLRAFFLRRTAQGVVWQCHLADDVRGRIRRARRSFGTTCSST